MKKIIRPIKATTDIEKIHHGAFSDIAYDLEKLGYKVSVDNNYKMTITCEKDKDFMPEIKVNTVEEEGTYYFNADVKFPELKYDDMEFADSCHYWVDDKWVPVSKWITQLSKFGYTPKDWEDSDDID